MLLTMAKRTREENPKQKFEPQWVHVQITDPVLWMHFEKMAKTHQGGRSAFVRWLIDREWARRATGPLVLPEGAVVPDAEARQANGVHWVGDVESPIASRKPKSEGGEGK